MCTNPSGFDALEGSKLYAYEFAVNRIESARNRIMTSGEPLSMTGGEPTIHPDFLKLTKWFRGNFPNNRIHLATNGRLFSYDKFAKEFTKLGKLTVEVPIHGHTAQLHDAVTRVPGSFEQTVDGIYNIIKYKSASDVLELRIILTRLTYQKLDLILDFIKNKFSMVNSVVIIFPELEGICGDNVESVGLSYTEVMPVIKQTMSRWSGQFNSLRLYHFPLCTVPKELWPYTWRTLRGDEVTYLEKCDNCKYKNYCLGIHVDYLELKGGEEFNPITEDIQLELDAGNPFYHPIKNIQ